GILDWVPTGFQFHLKAPVGMHLEGPTTDTMIFDFQDGRRHEVIVEDRYMFQRGNHYVKMQPDGKGGFVSNVNLIAPGVFSNIVMELPNDPSKAILAGRFPPSDQLLIL